MKRLIVLGLALTASFAAVTATAQNSNPVDARIALMKSQGGSAFRTFRMLRGDVPYDAQAAATAMLNIADSAPKIAALFPPGSTGGNSKALPTIWTANDEFVANTKKLAELATAAATVAPQGIDAFKAAFGRLNDTCNGCHDKFRAG